jgi:hypothetical protein
VAGRIKSMKNSNDPSGIEIYIITILQCRNFMSNFSDRKCHITDKI